MEILSKNDTMPKVTIIKDDMAKKLKKAAEKQAFAAFYVLFVMVSMIP
jgi:hypothetical protein